MKETRNSVEIKLPSEKLHLSKSFSISADELTTFTYDLTVIATGSSQSGNKYILKPQIDESGAKYKQTGSKNKAGRTRD